MGFVVFVFVDDTGDSVFSVYTGFSFSYCDFRTLSVFSVNADFSVFSVFADGKFVI